ncbi:MAG: hypothetical protein AVDCRST_MAG59-3316 [uncultured Thermomicrobiales bacterium]|uniref:Uncharacterized protein n=1 Tax=uncultured Thermomicrobiales bacterium TaxID=1645740 RepID=A0A6J4V9B2_9BACT|nr:MAG: hypothetical protein AVDCRST_MAG59-3316 [uncultured Thermomicrobiales bacterium]
MGRDHRRRLPEVQENRTRGGGVDPGSGRRPQRRPELPPFPANARFHTAGRSCVRRRAGW